MALIASLLLIFLLSPARAQESADIAPAERLDVSLITCFPGPEIYELCGHSALRIRTADSDSVWNYGLFNFNEPNFVARFVKGETDYMMGGYPFEWFLPEYERRGSRVVEQHLNLTPEEARTLRAMLQSEQLRDHGRYRYNYVRDNCATRIITRLDQAADTEIVYPDSLRYTTFRNEMRAYHANYPWYQLGIDVALGGGLDRPLERRQDMFVPVELMRKAAGAHFPDGRPLVSHETVLNEGRADAVLPPTRFWWTPLFWSVALLAASLLIAGIDLMRGRLSRWFYALFFLLLGTAGCVVAFLVFASEHEATSPNALLLWLNPLQLLVPLLIWSRRTRPVVTAWMIASGAVLLALLCAWPFQTQSTNPALFPLMGATLILSATYAIISLRNVYSVKPASPKAASRRQPTRRR